MRRTLAPIALVASVTIPAFLAGCTTETAESPEEAAPDLTPWVRALPMGCLPTAVASGPDGDIFFGGRFQGTINLGGGPLSTNAGTAVFLAHVDPRGEHLMSGATGHDDTVANVGVGPGGELFAAGMFSGKMSFGSGKLEGDLDGFVTAFRPDGEPRFSRQIAAKTQVWLHHLAPTPEGGVVISAYADAMTDLGEGPDGDQPTPQMIVVKYGPAGDLRWARRWDISPITEIGVAVDREGAVYVASATLGHLQFGTSEMSYGAFVGKLSADGDPEWLVRSLPEDGYPPQIHEVATDADGDVYVSGYYYYQPFSLGGVSLPPSQQYNGFVVKLSGEGKGLYAKAIVTNNYGGSLDIAPAPNGEVLLGMTVQNPVDLGGVVIGTTDINGIVARLDDKGDHVASLALGGPASHYVYDIAADSKGQALILGGFDWALDLEGSHFESPGALTTVLARVALK